MKIIRLSERRRQRERRAAELDRALDQSLAAVPVPEDFTAELDAARRMAESHLPIAAPSEGLVALRAALAARRSADIARSRSRWIIQGVPGAVAAASVGLAVFFGLQSQPSGLAGAQNAAAALREITVRMQQVNQVAASNNLPGVVQAAQSALASLVAAQQVAAPLPADDPLKDVLLQTADAKIAELETLLAQLRLPPVASLPPVTTTGGQSASASGALSGAAPTTTTTSTPASSTTSSTSSSTTTTTLGSGTSTTTTTSAGSQSSTTTTTTKPAPPTTTTSSTTTSTTPIPPPPSTTTTTAPAPPAGQ